MASANAHIAANAMTAIRVRAAACCVISTGSFDFADVMSP
jgi:hypothetical protein